MTSRHALWTNHEIRRLRKMHKVWRRPSDDMLSAAFPRHSPSSSRQTALALGIRARCECHRDQALRWLRLAHEYFQRREAGLLA